MFRTIMPYGRLYFGSCHGTFLKGQGSNGRYHLCTYPTDSRCSSSTLHCNTLSSQLKTNRSVSCSRCYSSQRVKWSEKMPLLLNQENLKEVMASFDQVLLDCDGVLWATDHYTRFDRIPEALQKLRNMGKDILFVTNNSMHSRKSFAQKIYSYTGYEADMERIFCVSYVAAQHIKNYTSAQGKCYMIGNTGMQEELNDIGIEVLGYGTDNDTPSDERDQLLKHELHNNVEAVLVGFDHHFSYNKLLKAVSYLKDSSCLYIATNDKEVRVPIGQRHVQPLTGSLVAAVSAAAKREPCVIGKPNCDILECIKKTKDLDLTRTIMIGDSMAADMHFAFNSNIKSMLILTGASSVENVQTAVDTKEKHLIPDFILPEFNNFAEYL